MEKVAKHKVVYVYRDFWFKIIGCLVAAELIDTLGREESIFLRITSASFYTDLLGGFIISLLLWEFIRFVTRKLDNHFDWINNSVQRISLQLIFGVITPVILCFVFTLLFMKQAYQQDIFKTSWLTSEFYAVILIIILINLIYFTWWLFINWQESQKEQPLPGEFLQNADLPIVQTSNTAPTTIEVSKGNVNILLLPEEIAYIILDGSYSFVRTHADQSFVTTYALDELFKKLGESSFFRANRQAIVSRKSCKAYKSIEHGKIEVELAPLNKIPVIISQKRAKDFRKWIVGEIISSKPDILQP
ncbi:MAG: LytR/AlgR family response regulator transcription factor [Flavitalea sp.]